MKIALQTLAVIYLVVCIPILIIGSWVTFRVLSSGSGLSVFISVMFAITGILIPGIPAYISVRYIRKKTENAAYGISVLTGILVWTLV